MRIRLADRRKALHPAAMKQYTAPALIVALSVIAAPGFTRTPDTLDPSSKWVVNYADDMCLLERRFGADPNAVWLAFEVDPMGQGAALHISRIGRSAGGSERAKILADGVQVAAHDAYSSFYDKRQLIMTSTGVDKGELARLRVASTIGIIRYSGPSYSFKVPLIASALDALDKCRVDLVDGWGMTAVQQARLKTAAKVIGVGGTSKFDSDDYPNAALAKSSQGKARVRLRIDPNGQVGQCTVMHSSGSKPIDDKTCEVYRLRYRYKPALDANDKPMTSFAVAVVTWVIPDL